MLVYVLFTIIFAANFISGYGFVDTSQYGNTLSISQRQRFLSFPLHQTARHFEDKIKVPIKRQLSMGQVTATSHRRMEKNDIIIYEPTNFIVVFATLVTIGLVYFIDDACLLSSTQSTVISASNYAYLGI